MGPACSWQLEACHQVVHAWLLAVIHRVAINNRVPIEDQDTGRQKSSSVEAL